MASKKKKIEHVDGLGPEDLKKIHRALGQVRSWSYPVRLVRKRCMGADGFPRCENKKCPHKGKPMPKIQIDHVFPIGEIGGPAYIQKMFVRSDQLQALCKDCHNVKTKGERAKAPKKIKDFF